MWRAIIMSVGLCLVVLGGAMRGSLPRAGGAGNRLVDTYNNGFDSPYTTTFDDPASYGGETSLAPRRRVIVTPEWAPWGLLSAGVLAFLYASALPTGGE